MAQVISFRALHYNAGAVRGLERVVTQPYDKISPEMQARYYDLSPYNLVRIIRGRASQQDSPGDNVYTRATRDLNDWVERGILAGDPEPALYPYYQAYEVPGQPGTRKERRGFIALLHLEDYANHVVYRHEETLSGPKADRMELLKATRTHYGQIFMLYSDPAGAIERQLASASKLEPWERVVDEYATTHSVWRITDPAAVREVSDAMRDKKLVIADGHHRYETALAYRDYCRAQGRADDRAEYVMATFIRMETEGLSILPTHRVVHSLAHFDEPQFRQAASRLFEIEDRGAASGASLAGFQNELARAGRERPAFGVCARNSTPGAKLLLMRLRPGADLSHELPDLPPGLARLDVVVLHRLLLEGALGIDRQAVREERNIHYVRELDQAVRQVEDDRAEVAFLMNPTPIEEVRDNALAGNVLPQKSTDFYPKLLSGLTMYRLDYPAGI